MNNGAHPTPYSDGTLAIHIMYADSPILKDIEISNVYGSGICIWKCTDAIIQNVTTYNVSANQVLSADGKMNQLITLDTQYGRVLVLTLKFPIVKHLIIVYIAVIQN